MVYYVQSLPCIPALLRVTRRHANSGSFADRQKPAIVCWKLLPKVALTLYCQFLICHFAHGRLALRCCLLLMCHFVHGCLLRCRLLHSRSSGRVILCLRLLHLSSCVSDLASFVRSRWRMCSRTCLACFCLLESCSAGGGVVGSESHVERLVVILLGLGGEKARLMFL